ncbi:MAG: hypothetical protein DWQ02_15595 [Bacteroidetes bacterium]|nr:MAG: hypothetical protein DWQ02_15595 [Bacteroidota bacterium]
MKLQLSTQINCPPRQVFSWIDDPEKAKLWQKGVKKTEILKETPEKTGTTFREEIEENGKRLIIFGEITRYVPNKLIAFLLDSKIHTVKATFSVSGSEHLTTFSANWQIKWKFPMSLMAGLFHKRIKSNILEQSKSEFSELKRLCEI